MPASDFQIIPTWVQLEEPKFFVREKISESFFKDRQVVSDDPVYIANLKFLGITDVQAKTIRDHFIARRGEYESFNWISPYVPSYIISMFVSAQETAFTARWIAGSLKSTALAKGWNIEISMYLVGNPGIEFGGTRIIETGEIRETEEGDTRVLEGVIL